jgi:hypothetical protein
MTGDTGAARAALVAARAEPGPYRRLMTGHLDRLLGALD